MVYYNPVYDLLAVNYGTFHAELSHVTLLEYTDDGCGVFLLTSEWIIVGSL